MAKASLTLAQQLINIRSITPNDGGCQDLIIDKLKNLGFTITPLDSNGVRNFWAQRGTAEPLFTFSGHTDVVPPGAETKWKSDPFAATVRDGNLYGRGAADMKGALAAMLTATENFIEQHPNHKGSIGFMITSDEEGDATDGTIKIVDYLQAHKIKPTWCLIGEATSRDQIGDVIKIGRRGSLHGFLQVIGKQGHIAYPNLAINPIHRSFKALDALTQVEWDQGNEHFSPTSLQIYNINADTGASNVIPGSLTARFNFRFAPVSTADNLQQRVHEVFDTHGLEYHIDWNLMSQPFLSTPAELTAATQQSVHEVCGYTPEINTTGGTSDGRFIHQLGCELLELGSVNASIHQVNEHIKVAELEKLTELYQRVLEKLLA